MPLEFDGTDGSVDCGSDSTLDNIFVGGGTIMAWINPDSFGQNSFGRILAKTALVGGAGWFFYIAATTDRLVFFHSFSIGPGGAWAFDDVITLDAWHHVAAIYDNGDVTNDPIVYLDGVVQTLDVEDTPTGTAFDDASTNLIIGNRADLNRTFDGEIEDARAYDRRLTATEVQEIVVMNGRDSIRTGLIGRWKMFGVAGVAAGTVIDDGPNKNDGTPDGTVTYTTSERTFSRRREVA